MKNINDYIKWLEKENRTRCDNKPHKEFVEILKLSEIRRLMKTIISWENDDNENIRKYYDPIYKKQIKLPLSKIPEKTLIKMYGNVFINNKGQYCLYNSCCR